MLVGREHATGREQRRGRQGVEGCTHDYIMPWVLAMPRRRAGLLRPSIRAVVDDGQPLRCAARFCCLARTAKKLLASVLQAARW